MQIIGFTLKKILIERKNPIQGKLEIKSNITIDDIKTEEVTISKSPSLKFDFTFSLDYEPNVAKLEIKGSIIIMDDSEEYKEILKSWKKKKFESTIKTNIFNFILEKCNIKAIQLEDELALPIHLPFPKITNNPTPQKEQKEQKESSNPKYAG